MNLIIKCEAETPRTAKLIEVIHIRCGRGKGTLDSVFRLLDQYWSKDGKLLAEYDPAPEVK